MTTMQNGRINANNIYTTPPKVNPQVIQEPLKLVLQLIYFLIACIPMTLYSMYDFIAKEQKSIERQIVLITGGARGLGRELCHRFARQGAHIVSVDIEEDGNAETVAQIKEKYPDVKVKGYRCNVCSTEDIHKLHEDVKRDFGQVDILVNNAGTVVSSSLLHTEDKYIDLMVDLNLKSHFKMIREFLPAMIERNSGHIVAIGSLSGVSSLVNLSLYSATKHGVLAFMESLHDELNANPNNKIQTTCVCPYFIRTNLQYSMEWNLRLPELSGAFVAKNIILAVKKNWRLVSVPHGFYAGLVCLRLMPDSLRILLRNIFYVKITPTKQAKPLNGNGLHVKSS